MRILNISKRKLQYLKSSGEISYHLPEKGNRTYYLLSDILDWIKKAGLKACMEKLEFNKSTYENKLWS